MTQLSIMEKVTKLLDNDFIIRKCISRDIASLRALSRYIINELQLKEGNIDAVMSAVRRYKKSRKDESSEKLRKLFSRLAVKTRSNVVDMRVQKSKKSVENISKLNSQVDIEKGEIIMAIQSEQSITVIIDEKNLDKFHGIFAKSDIVSMERKLVAINLQFTQEAQEIKSIVAIVTSSFSAEGINLVEIISSAPELITIIKKEDTVKALKVIEKLQEME